jgi:hypothetical protein
VPLVSGELPRRGCGRRRLCWPEKRSEADRPIPAVHLRSDDPILNNPGPILTVRLESDGPGPLPPHPAVLSTRPRLSAAHARSARLAPPVNRPRPLCPPGPACQPPAPALPARPRLSAAHAAARSRARPQI